jgi:hypothetical protein
MSKAKKVSSKKGTAGGSSGQVAAQAKKRRGPKSHLELSKSRVDEDMVAGAEEMLDGDDEDDEDDDQGAEKQERPQLAKKKKHDTNFLLQLDERGVSK